MAYFIKKVVEGDNNAETNKWIIQNSKDVFSNGHSMNITRHELAISWHKMVLDDSFYNEFSKEVNTLIEKENDMLVKESLLVARDGVRRQ